MRDDPAQHLAALSRIADANDDELPAIRRRPRTKHGRLDVADVERNGVSHSGCLAAQRQRVRVLWSESSTVKVAEVTISLGINISLLLSEKADAIKREVFAHEPESMV